MQNIPGRKILFVSFLFGLFLWLLDAVADYFVFFPRQQTFLEVAFLEVPKHDLFLRTLFVLLSLFAGMCLAQWVHRHAILQRRLDHLNRILLSVRNVNQLITKETDRRRLLDQTCQLLVETRGFYNAWIVLLDQHGRPCPPFHHAGFDGDFDPMIRELESAAIPACARRAIERGGIYVMEHPSSQCPQCPNRTKYPNRSAIAACLKHGQRVFGWLTVSIPHSFVQDLQERDLVEEVANDIAFALHNIEIEASHRDDVAALQESERKHRDLFHGIRDAIYVTDTDRNVVDCNTAFTELFGCKLDELRGTKAGAVYADPGEYERVHEPICSSSGDADFFADVHYRKKSGQVFIGETCIFCLRDTQRRLRGYMGMIRDVTEQKQAEQALKQNERRFRTLFESAPIGIFTTTSDGRPLAINTSMARILGLDSPQEAIAHFSNLSSDLYVHPERRREFVRLLREHGRVEGFQYEARTFDGRQVWLNMNARVAEWVDADSFIIEGFATDITEHKEAEAALASKNAELERFVYTISHDLQSPLITIRGFIGHLERDVASGDTDRVRSDVERIERSARRMGELLDGLLELSRIGRIANPSEQVDLRVLVREVIESLGGMLAPSGVRVEVAADLPVVWGDRHRLGEVYQNLIENAVKFMGEQTEPVIEIGVRWVRTERVLFVRDNGSGIETRDHESVFGLFNQLDPRAGGTGVGLALVQRIIEVHQGRIWIESAGRGRGTTFCFTLPEVEEQSDG